MPSVIEKTKNLYTSWFQYHQIIPKIHRFSLGLKIDSLFVEALEFMITASFLPPNEKLPFIRYALRKMDTAKIFLMILWETKSLNNKQYILLSTKAEEVGKMLGGWSGQIIKQNSPYKKQGEK